MSNSRRGAFIVVEGAESAEKTALCEHFVETLTAAGVVTKLIRFPNFTSTTGQLLSTTVQMNQPARHLLHVANLWESAEELDASLQWQNGRL